MSALCQKRKYAAQQKGRLFDHLALVLTVAVVCMAILEHYSAAWRARRPAAELSAIGGSVTNASRHFREQYRRLFHQPRR